MFRCGYIFCVIKSVFMSLILIISLSSFPFFLDLLHDLVKLWIRANKVFDSTSSILWWDRISQALVLVDKFDGSTVLHIFPLSGLEALHLLDIIILLMCDFIKLSNHELGLLVNDRTIGYPLLTEVLATQI